MPKIFSSNKNSGAAPGKIFSSNRGPSRHNISSLLDTAGVGKKPSNNRAGRYAAGAAAKGVKAAGNKAVNMAIDKAAQGLAAETGGVSLVAGEIIKRHKKETIILILLIIIIQLLPLLFILWILIGDQYMQLSQMSPQQNPLQITKSGPSQAKAGDTLKYTLTVSYPGSAQDVVISDPFPAGTSYVSSSPQGTVSKNTITWDAKKLNLGLSDPINITVNLTLKATKDNTNIYNVAQVSLTGGSIGRGGNVPPNHDTCNGKYTLNNPFGNFGDPQCNFTQQQLGTQLHQLDSSNYYIWDCIAAHESGYNPNAYLAASASGFGAFGLFQMNPQGKGNGSYDDGTVNWPLQISNAINYNNRVIHGSFAYWATYAGCH